ncbi:MAG: hypothetical protein ACFCUJ_10670 [Thiotrichales bacterium]
MKDENNEQSNTVDEVQEIKSDNVAAVASTVPAEAPQVEPPAEVNAASSAIAEEAPKAVAKKPKKDKKPAKFKKPKVVRDSFTMPEFEYAQIDDIKRGCLGDGFSIKKSEILRIGVAMIARLPAEEVKQHLARLLPIKTGRPQKSKS